jgi:glycosyltransferase involved in cell wall biosynthesis
MEGLAKHFRRTLYVEHSATFLKVISSRNFPISDLWEYLLPPKKLGEKLWLVKAPPGLPRRLGLEKVNRYNHLVMARGIKRQLTPNEKVVLWVAGPTGADIIGLVDASIIVYDCYDAFGTFAWEVPHVGYINRLEERLLAGSDIILTTSVGLKEKAGQDDPRVHLIRNACDFEHFAERCDPPPGFRPVIDLKRLGKPLIGYMGDIAEWLDKDLVRWLAKTRPDWNFVFFGSKKVDVSALASLPNVHFPGRVPYDDLPCYIHHFDCLWIPFVLNDLTREVNPVKMYEYLATGIPIVSAAMPEVVRHEDVISIGRSNEDFLDKMEQLLHEEDHGRKSKRQEVARANSWADRIEKVAEIISGALEVKAGRH